MRGRSLFLLTTVLLALALTACGGTATPPPTPTPTPPANAAAIVDAASKAMLALTKYQATTVMELTGAGGGNVTLKVLLRGSMVAPETPDQQLRFKGEVITSTLQALPVGTVAVVGPTNMIYDPVQKVVIQGATGVGGSELYNLFLGSQVRVATLLQPVLASATVAGEETVGAYKTWKLTLAPKPEAAAASLLGDGAQGTAWIDKATNLPVKFNYQDKDVGITWTASNVDITTNITDEQLTFTPPADAQVVDGTVPNQTVAVATVEEASAKAGFKPLLPSYLPADLPTSASKIAVRTVQPLGNIIELSYGVQSAAPASTPFPGMEDFNPLVTKGISVQALKGTVNLPANWPTSAVISDAKVHGQPAVEVVLSENQAAITWQEGGVFYAVRSNGFGIAEVRKVAESLK